MSFTEDSDEERGGESDGDDDLEIEEEIDRNDPVRPEPGEVVGFEFLRVNYSAKEEILEQEKAPSQSTSSSTNRLVEFLTLHHASQLHNFQMA